MSYSTTLQLICKACACFKKMFFSIENSLCSFIKKKDGLLPNLKQFDIVSVAQEKSLIEWNKAATKTKDKDTPREEEK